MWNWQDAKIALEWLFCTGEVTTATRRNFERIYDLTERVLPADVLAAPVPSREDAQRDLVRIAARAHGVATERQLRDYFDLPAADAKARVSELVESDALRPVRVDGVTQKMYAWADAAAPEHVLSVEELTGSLAGEVGRSAADIAAAVDRLATEAVVRYPRDDIAILVLRAEDGYEPSSLSRG